jgi:hypothetical protein
MATLKSENKSETRLATAGRDSSNEIRKEEIGVSLDRKENLRGIESTGCLEKNAAVG